MLGQHSGDKPVYAQEVFWPGNKYHGTFDTDETILETAARLGWVVASIKHDWATVYAAS